MSALRRRLSIAAVIAIPLLLALAAIAGVLLLRQGGFAPYRVPTKRVLAIATDAATIDQGAYLARLGNCLGCHTAAGGALLAGGRAFDTGYGTVYSSNLTPHAGAGIGDWSVEEFRHAMRHGVSRHGVQSPVFPYANFAHLRDDELDALFAWLRTQPASGHVPPGDDYDFPANLPGAMVAWRMLEYRPMPRNDSAERGAHLVTGIGHCAMCHGARGSFGALSSDSFLGGGRLRGWYAPALDRESLAAYEPGELQDYLRLGASKNHAAYGLMADVIYGNLQHLDPADATAIAGYLQSLPAPPAPREAARNAKPGSDQLAQGDALYREHCADCHGDDLEGEAHKFPALARAASLTGPDPVNAVKMILFGGAAPMTRDGPLPYSMPPFAQTLSGDEVAALVNTLRHRAGNDARPLTADDIGAMGGIDVP